MFRTPQLELKYIAGEAIGILAPQLVDAIPHKESVATFGVDVVNLKQVSVEFPINSRESVDSIRENDILPAIRRIVDYIAEDCGEDWIMIAVMPDQADIGTNSLRVVLGGVCMRATESPCSDGENDKLIKFDISYAVKRNGDSDASTKH